MTILEVEKDKVKKICDALKEEAIEPAKKEAEEILEKAKKQAEEIIKDAKSQADKIFADGKLSMQREKETFLTSLEQGYSQTIERVRQGIEKELFAPALKSSILEKLEEPDLIGKLLSAVVGAIEKEGIEGDITAFIGSTMTPREINALLAQKVIDRLQEKSVLLGSMKGGVSVKIIDQNITVEVSDAALEELILGYIREDLRNMLFGSK